MTDERTLTLFDRINLANCAMQRAIAAPVRDRDRFDNEYGTARLWTKYRIHASASYRFIEAD
jgi:hypothetical protein